MIGDQYVFSFYIWWFESEQHSNLLWNLLTLYDSKTSEQNDTDSITDKAI